VDSYCIEEALKKLNGTYQFKVSDLQAKFGVWSPLADSTRIGLDNIVGVNSFLEFVEKALVPYL